MEAVTVDDWEPSFAARLGAAAALAGSLFVGPSLNLKTILGDMNGLYWVAAAVVVSFVKAALDAWVVLVEIGR